MNDLPSFSKIEPREREWDKRMNAIGVQPKATPLEFLQAVYTNSELPLNTRIKAAVEALPFVHPKLSVAAVVEGRDFAALLDARTRRAKMIEASNNSQVSQVERSVQANELDDL